MADDQKPFRIETVIDAPAADVWRALTEPELIREWFGWQYDGLDAEIRSIFVDGAKRFPPDRIALDPGQEFELEPSGEWRTMVRVFTTNPYAGAALTVGRGRYDAVEEGWRGFFEQLRFFLERHPDEHRRTLHLTGIVGGPDALAAVDPAAAEEIWHDSRFGRFTVDGEGHLIAVMAEQPLSVPEPGPVAVTVTAYGKGERGFAELRERWTSRWRDTAEYGEIVC